jgi:hypothetical protein
VLSLAGAPKCFSPRTFPGAGCLGLKSILYPHSETPLPNFLLGDERDPGNVCVFVWEKKQRNMDTVIGKVRRSPRHSVLVPIVIRTQKTKSMRAFPRISEKQFDPFAGYVRRVLSPFLALTNLSTWPFFFVWAHMSVDWMLRKANRIGVKIGSEHVLVLYALLPPSCALTSTSHNITSLRFDLRTVGLQCILSRLRIEFLYLRRSLSRAEHVLSFPDRRSVCVLGCAFVFPPIT